MSTLSESGIAMSAKCLWCGIWVRGSMINLLWPYTLLNYAMPLSVTYTTLDAEGNTFRWIQLRLLSTLLLVAEETTEIVYYMVCLSAILIICREFRAQALDLSLCWANVATLPQCSISCTGFLSHFVLIFRFYF